MKKFDDIISLVRYLNQHDILFQSISYSLVAIITTTIITREEVNVGTKDKKIRQDAK